MRILITGGCGFLGSNLAADALARGDRVTVLDDCSRHGSERNLAWLREQGDFEHVRADIRDAARVLAAVAAAEPKTVYHVAGQVAMTTSLADPRLDFEVNALGTLNVLEAVRAAAPRAVVVYSSTNKVYGDLEQYRYREEATRWRCIDWPEGFDETVPLDFHSPYGCSKGAADQYMLDYHRMFGLRTVVFRHSSMYGGRQFATADQGWIGWFCRQAVIQEDDAGAPAFAIHGDGKQVRDVLHADDMIALYRAAAAAPPAALGRAYNVGGGMPNSLSLLELFDLLGRLIGRPLRFTRREPRASDQRVFVADLRRVADALGWRPAVPAERGIAAMLEWSRQAAELPG